MWDTGNHMWWIGVGVVHMLMFWVFIIMAVFVMMRWLSERSDRGADKTALDVLRERYARGEIDNEEFARKKRDLES